MSTSAISVRDTRQGFLRRVLQADGLVCGLAGLLLFAAASPLSDLLGLSVTFLRVVGAILIPYAAVLLYLATRDVVSRRGAWGVVAVNVVWALDSVGLLLTGWVDPTTVGSVFIIGQALMVVAFAELQIIALRRGS